MSKPYDALLALIPEGKENGVARSDLAEYLNISPRKVSALVAQARRDSIVICSGNSGYYTAKTVEEKEACYRRLHSMALSLHVAMKTVRKELKEAGYFDKKEGKEK